MNKSFVILFAILFICIVIGIFYYFIFARETTETIQLGSGSKNMVQHGVDFSDGKSVDVIDYQGHYLLVSSLRVGESHPPHATGPGCPEQHWHAESAVTAVIDGTVHSDPLSGGCGFGTLSERPVMMYFPNELLAE